MRRRDGSGEKEFRAARTRIWLRIASRDLGWNRTRSFRSVINSVFEGGVGWESAGRLERSIESEGRDDDREERVCWKEGDAARDWGGDV